MHILVVEGILKEKYGSLMLCKSSLMNINMKNEEVEGKYDA